MQMKLYVIIASRWATFLDFKLPILPTLPFQHRFMAWVCIVVSQYDPIVTIPGVTDCTHYDPN